jgi:hypothetical protein
VHPCRLNLFIILGLPGLVHPISFALAPPLRLMVQYFDSSVQIDVDIGSSTVANGVLGLVCGVITTLVVDMAFLVQVQIGHLRNAQSLR